MKHTLISINSSGKENQINDLPVQNRPTFGSPSVSAYGAVGLPELDPIINASVSMPSIKPVELDPDERVSLVPFISHHRVDEDSLWIAVEDGKIFISDEMGDYILCNLMSGKTPRQVSDLLTTSFEMSSDTAWSICLGNLARLVAAGFVEGVQGYHSIKQVRPKAFARFHLTNRCQLECIHCYTNSSPRLSSEGELTKERWIKLVEDFADNGGERILFTGGEALVYRGCLEIMKAAKDRGLEVTLFSNGILVPKYINEIKTAVDIVQISLDGPGPATHDEIRGKNQFNKAIRAIWSLLEADIETRVSTTIMMNNWEAIRSEFVSLVEHFEDTKLSFRVSYGAMSHGRGEELDHSLDSNKVRRYVDSLLTRISTTENREEGPNFVKKISGCGYAEQLVVAPDGMVFPCHLMSGALGHIDDLPLYGITRYLERTAEAFSVDNRVGCGSCDMRHVCGGTCRVEDEKHTGSRLITTCTDDEKLRKKRFLVRRYKPAGTPSVRVANEHLPI